MNTPRNQDETREDYRTRLNATEAARKVKLKGTVFWNSTEKGTYVKNPKTPKPASNTSTKTVNPVEEKYGSEQ